MGVTLGSARRGFLAVFLGLISAGAEASEPNAQRVSHFVGAAGESVPILRKSLTHWKQKVCFLRCLRARAP